MLWSIHFLSNYSERVPGQTPKKYRVIYVVCLYDYQHSKFVDLRKRETEGGGEGNLEK